MSEATLSTLDPRTARLVLDREETISRAALRQWLTSDEGKRAARARPGFGLAGTAILPATPIPTALLSDGKSALKSRTGVGHITPLESTRFRGETRAERNAAMLRQYRHALSATENVIAEDASMLIGTFTELRSYFNGIGDGRRVVICDKAIARCRRVQYGQRP